jgi:DUF1365 family protein
MAVFSAQPLIGTGEVLHTRLRPVRHAFRYPSFFVLLPLRSLRAQGTGALPRNRFGLVSFHDRDHGDGRADSLAWLDETLQAQGVHDADGEVWLHCFPRVLGFAFKPVSFWYAHRADGGLAAVLVEVNNTFGERHCYLLQGAGLRFGAEQRAAKVFHVSPFCAVQGGYRFRFFRNDLGPQAAATPRTLVRIDHDDAQGALLQTSVSGRLAPLTAASLRQAFWRMPLLTLGVVARIHWQALQLWLQRVPFFRKPAPPLQAVSRPPASPSSSPVL